MSSVGGSGNAPCLGHRGQQVQSARL
uniref:Uncharacterized protein n=1 Tax=Anguilla anguilla TaxID=7936 RepID=A0A0E9QRY2_ANGAN